ncbi:hypothetical protein ACTVZK_33430, partial [Pseudomonas aeruginosa]|uniref:hypothetical protein n=1 Tax=Pseudomonas aeruginosa TaxID=287 RepID=UPI003FA73E2E
MKMKKTAFVALVGQKVFKEWSEVTDEKKKKRISEEQVKEIERARSMAGKCSGQPIPDSGLSFSSATAGGNPSLN